MRTPNIRAEAALSARAIPLCFQRPGSRKDPGLFVFSSAGGDRAARRCSFTICRGDAAPALAGTRPANNRSGGPQWAQPCPRSAPLRVCPSRHHRRAAFATGPVGCAGSRAPTCSESAHRSVWPVLAWGHSRSGISEKEDGGPDLRKRSRGDTAKAWIPASPRASAPWCRGSIRQAHRAAQAADHRFTAVVVSRMRMHGK
jgi:hypothetical protein